MSGFGGIDRRSLLMGGAAALLSGAANAETKAYPSVDAFVDSVGVNVHVSSEPYASGFDRFRGLIGKSGIRHLRDELRPSNDLDRWKDLSTAFGLRWNALVSPATNTVAEMMRYLDALGVEHLSAIEGQNEGDSDWFRSLPGVGDTWSAKVVDYQREIYRALRVRYPATILPLLSPSVIDWKPTDVSLLRPSADVSDIVAIHSYVQHGQEPETLDDYAGLPWYLRNMRDAFRPGAPVMATEAGYNTLVAKRGSGVSEKAAAIYLPRLLLNNFASGVLRTFLYEFMDGGDDPNDGEAHWGLVRFDGSPKPAYHAVSALLGALADPGNGQHTRNRLRVDLPSAPPEVRSVVLQKRDGSLVVAVWRAVRCWDPETRTDIDVQPAPLRISIHGQIKSAAYAALDVPTEWTDIPTHGGEISPMVGDKVVTVRLGV